MTETWDDSGGDRKPAWWSRNERLREELDLPAYEPSRLTDGTYVHEAITRLEATYECSIQLRVKNPQYSNTWSVIVDGKPRIDVDCRRTNRGNTIFRLTSTELETVVRRSTTRLSPDSDSPSEEGSN